MTCPSALRGALPFGSRVSSKRRPYRSGQVASARAAFPKGNPSLRLRNELGAVYDDEMFSPLYPRCGQPATSPWRLALITVMQFAEGLSDRQAADAVRSRIDWKYALGLALGDAGFDFSVLCEFRARLLAGGLERLLLEAMLARFKERGLLKARGRQRTDSSHVLAAVRAVNRLESVGETLRAALNALAAAAPDWLAAHAEATWTERYGRRIEETRLPKGEAPRKALGAVIGTDGHILLAAVYAPAAPPWLREMPAVETLRRAWVHQFYIDADGRVTWRERTDLPPAGVRFDSPYDVEARFGNKRSTTWSGYKVHLTETCDADRPHFIVHVETTPAPLADIAMTAPIHRALAQKELLPATHFADAGYVDADLLLASETTYGIELIGPVRPNVSWQAKAGTGYDISAFAIDWGAQKVTCPQGHESVDWVPGRDRWGNARVHVAFADRTCRVCPSRSQCTRAKTAPRELTIRIAGHHEAIQDARRRQETAAWKALYRVRAGVEGCLSQAVRLCGLRRSRYIGIAKTRLQHVATAAAVNVVRLDAWLTDTPFAKTRTSRFAKLTLAAA